VVREYGLAEVPADLGGVTELIRSQITEGKKAVMRIAVLIAHARREHFAADPAGWLEWARSEFGYERRHCFRCLKAGGLLLSGVPHAALLGCDTDKLELLAGIPAQLLRPFLERHPDVAELDRDEVRTLCRAWAGAVSEPADADEPKPETKPARAPRAQRTVCDDVEELAALAEDEPAMKSAAVLLDPMTSFTAGFTALNLGILRLETTAARLEPPQAAAIEKLYADLGSEIRKLLKG